VCTKTYPALIRSNEDLFLLAFDGSIVHLAVFWVNFVLQLGHSVAEGDALLPGLGCVSSSLQVEISVVLKDTSLLDVSLVVGGLLGILTVADLLVFGLAQTRGNIRVGTDLSGLDL
jgi:hypothetical protein